ncbi:MAG: alanine:cation symporter family protein [Bacteroidales bacterium]|nr:alanine:cation symporter family protein [Bacteroidales bacterium]
MEAILNILMGLNDVVWSYIVILLLAGSAIFFTVRLHFVQFRLVHEMLRLLVNPDKVRPEDIGPDELSESLPDVGKEKYISSLQAFFVSLASRIGTGNLAGVATAISVGGPGSVFWMWVLALLGSAIAFVESTLAQLYKRKGDGAFYGGPAYYMKYGLKKPWMGVLFAVLMVLSFAYTQSSVQSNTICAAWQKAFDVEPAVMGLMLTLMTLFIIFGGIHRVARFSSAVVPTMAVVYFILAFGIVIFNITELPHVLKLIFESAFGVGQVAGGVVGTTVMQGVKRGLFSNEAGEGSTPNAAATATVTHPVKQGLIQALGVFTDTLVVCTCTAFIIIVSGVDIHASSGVQLTQDALTSEVGWFGTPFIAIMILLFAFSSIVGNYFYGEMNVRFLTANPAVLLVFRLGAAGMVMLGSVVTLDFAWAMSDLFMALIVLCNLAAIVMLSRHAVFLLQDYRRQKAEGKNPVFHKEQMPEIADDLEAW